MGPLPLLYRREIAALFERPKSEPAYLPERCARCEEVLQEGEDSFCRSCREGLCERCYAFSHFCLCCPSDTEERSAECERALMEAGDE